MNIDEAVQQIKACAAQMNDLYGRVVFDEWALVSLVHNRANMLGYTGPRNDVFLKNFANDLGSLRTDLLNAKFSIGDFQFARHGTGTLFEAFLVAGEGIYLICNNTNASMTDIVKDPRWLNAQVPFAELSDKFRANPVKPIF